MEYHNMKEAKEIDYAIDYLIEIRSKYVDEIRTKESSMPDGVINAVARKLVNGLFDLEGKIVEELKERLKGL